MVKNAVKEEKMRQISGYEYEVFCANYLAKHGYKDVQVTRMSGDQGIDIIARRHGKWYGIQCKYYSGPVGNKAVQEAYTGARYHECDRAMVITNTYFTDSAEELAESTDVELMYWMQPVPSRKTVKKKVPKVKKKKGWIIFVLLIIAAIAILKYFSVL